MLNNEIKTCINEFAKNNGISLKVVLDIMNCSLLSLNKERKALCKKEEKIIKNKIISVNELINRIKLWM